MAFQLHFGIMYCPLLIKSEVNFIPSKWINLGKLKVNLGVYSEQERNSTFWLFIESCDFKVRSAVSIHWFFIQGGYAISETKQLSFLTVTHMLYDK